MQYSSENLSIKYYEMDNEDDYCCAYKYSISSIKKKVCLEN